ncbi:hypothetical protein GCM10020218_045300 [Dactylosporangium vinaceum]
MAFTLAGGEYAEVARDGEAEFRTLAVDPALQRRGVAQALVQACVERRSGSAAGGGDRGPAYQFGGFCAI